MICNNTLICLQEKGVKDKKQMSGNYVVYDIVTFKEIWTIKDAEMIFFSGKESEGQEDISEDCVSIKTLLFGL